MNRWSPPRGGLHRRGSGVLGDESDPNFRALLNPVAAFQVIFHLLHLAQALTTLPGVPLEHLLDLLQPIIVRTPFRSAHKRRRKAIDIVVERAGSVRGSR